MPTYDYECQACEHKFSAFQSMKDEPLKKCPECKKPKLKRLIGSGAGIIFKGSGFYCTDYKAKTGAPAPKASSDSEKSSGESSAPPVKEPEKSSPAPKAEPSEKGKKKGKANDAA